MRDELHVTFEGPEVGEYGVLLDDLQKTLNGVRRAVTLMVRHLMGVDTSRGRPPNPVREQSSLRLVGTSHGSLVAELSVGMPSNAAGSSQDYGQRALDQIVGWQPENDDSFPEPVADALRAIGTRLSPEVSVVWLGIPSSGRRLEIRRKGRERSVATRSERALLHGWLKQVNWARRTAQLHRYEREYVQLRFDAALDDEMLRLATQYVEVRGRGQFNKDDSWRTVQVEQVNGTRSWRETFDLEAFRNNPNPKIFDPDKVVTASEPFDVDEFLRIIYEGRDVGRKEPSEW